MSKTRVTPEDLMDMVVAADVYRTQALSGDISPILPPKRRPWLETLFNFFGLLLGQLHVLQPWALRWRADNKVNLLLSKGRTAVPADFKQIQDQIAGMARRLHHETGQWPATMVLTSHPPTMGPLEWLRFEQVRLGLLLADSVVTTAYKPWQYHPRPECFMAIDPFALDTITTPVAGLYSGFMHRIYLVYDRQSRTQSWLQKHFFLRHTGYAYIAARLLDRLKRNVPIVMVFPGGVPHNARLLYAAREFVLKLPVKLWPYSIHIAQQKWMDVLRRPVDGVRPCEKGELVPATRAALRELLAAWGLTDPERDRWLELFAKEFQQEIPYRFRLLRFLLRRLAARGKPVLLIAITHRAQAPYVQIPPPWGFYRDRQGQLQFLRGADSSPQRVEDIEATARAFSAEYSA